MSQWWIIAILIAGAIALPFIVRDTWQDLMLFFNPREALKDEAMRTHGGTARYDEAARRVDALSSRQTILLSLTGLAGLLITAWIFFG